MNKKQYLKKRLLLFWSEIGIFDILFKRLHEETLEDLQINSNWKFQTRAIKWWPFKLFVKLHESPLLIANIVKGAVSGLKQFLTTENPLKLMKNAFYFILKAVFVLMIFKFLFWLFGHVEKTVWLERET